MPFETGKAMMRRQFDRRFATVYFVGNGIDIGCGPDPVSNYAHTIPLMSSLRPWDVHDGDGALLKGIDDDSFDFVHSSHSLEHMDDPYVAMQNWIRVCKPGGHIIILLPDEDMFEQGVWPSRYAGHDHKTSWTIGKKHSWSPASKNLIEFLSDFLEEVEIIKIEKLDSTYNYNVPAVDQTRTMIGECAIELILRKRTKEEKSKNGRFPLEYFTIKTS